MALFANIDGVAEIRDVRQNPNEPFRRWFADDHFDLFVWYAPDKSISGFELSYDKFGREKALRWFVQGELTHYSVDSGEQSPLANRTPILIATSGKAEISRIIANFETSDHELPDNVRTLVRSKLREYCRENY